MAASAASVHQAATKSAATNNGGLPSSHHNADLVQQAKLPDSSAGIQPQPQSKYKVLYEAVKQADPAVVRQVVRDLSSQCLLGSDYHNVFVAGLVLNNASSTAVEQTIREYGKKMVRLCKQQIIDHLTSQDLDTLSDSILAKAGSSFLDKALARRLETIPARSLVNALARAERLGYEVQDVVEEHSEKPGYEHVVPSLGSSSSHPMVIHDETTNPPCTGPRPNAVQLAEQQPSQQPSQQLSPLVQATLAKSNAAVGPFGIRYCHACSRPCTGTDALLVVSGVSLFNNATADY
ncbi:hypothetical protein CDD82_7035 [Ophiocordyceps australis]|uniref:Uncharacterized protein n=1 Tax=Ophiocordyceps australis TaxID=1399860 RepID=A0A2C5XFI7_9HYPO|nr:hypothetical protein CDD82_7035 [Ophiocordyceps australis]